jgi:hypothetical protein
MDFSSCKNTEVAAGDWQTNQSFYVTFQSKNACFVQKHPIFAADMSFFSLLVCFHFQKANTITILHQPVS